MPKEKKTIQVKFIKEYANKQLANPGLQNQYKNGIICMLEKVLLESNTYKGFMFLSLNEDNTAPDFDTEGYFSRKYF